MGDVAKNKGGRPSGTPNPNGGRRLAPGQTERRVKVHASVLPALRDQVEEAAGREGRSVSSFIERVLGQYFGEAKIL